MVGDVGEQEPPFAGKRKGWDTLQVLCVTQDKLSACGNKEWGGAVYIGESAWEVRAEIRGIQRRKVMKILCGVMILASASATLAGNSAPAYPKEKVAEFVVEKLDVTTIPYAMRPKKDKGKKTFSDYGYVTRQMDEKEALVEATPGRRVAIRVLEQEQAGIYVCIDGSGKNASDGRIQRVLLLQWKGPDGLLKGRESSKDFNSCQAIGGLDDATGGSSY
jgi:hypothetical protein